MSVIKKWKSALSARTAAINDFNSDLADLRERIADTKTAITDLARAAPSVEEVTERVKAFCDRVIADASKHLAGLAALAGRSGSTTDFDILQRVDLTMSAMYGNATMGGLTPLQAWSLADEKGFRARTLAEAQQQANKSQRMSKVDASAAKARLEAELDGLEREEELLLRTAENSGLIIPRRPDASPKWLLAPDKELDI